MLDSPINEFFPFGAHLYCLEILRRVLKPVECSHICSSAQFWRNGRYYPPPEASRHDVFAVLQQQNDSCVKNLVFYASHSWTPSKRNNAATKEEGIGVVWAVEKILPYLYGNHLLWPVTIMLSDGSPGSQTWIEGFFAGFCANKSIILLWCRSPEKSIWMRMPF